MNAAPNNGRLWPSEMQEMLLHAALGDGSAAVDNYRAWSRQIDIRNSIDEGSYRLLPLLYANMTRLGVADSMLPRFKGVLRNVWVKAARRSALAGELLSSLRSEGVPTMVTKGLPLAMEYYASPALRPMNDLDIVVPNQFAQEASAVLEAQGFRAAQGGWGHEYAVRHALSHVHPEKGEVDLHRHVLFECLSEEADAHFREGAVPIDVSGAPTLRPCTTDLLLHVLVHGIRWNLFPPMRWIADSAMLLRSDDPVDWDRLVGFAERYRLTHRVELALAYLRDRFDMPVPDHALERLRGRSGFVERFEVFAMQGEDDRSTFRHLRRAAHVLRLATGDERKGLTRAIGSELVRRYGPARIARMRDRQSPVTRRLAG